ncbi:MAG: efflux RND transporter permease subunit [Acidobacteriota bacterium]
MSLVDTALRHRVAVFFLTAVVVVTGLVAYSSLPRENNPDVELPVIIVLVPYPGASPLDVEAQITNPLERELQGVANLKSLLSYSLEGASSVTVEFVAGTDIDDALQKVRDRVELAEPDFPEEAEDPIFQEVNFSDIPVVQVNLYGDVGQVRLKQLAEDLQDEIEAMPGVLRARLVGGVDRQVRVEVDPYKLYLYGLSLEDVLSAVARENVSIPGGQLDTGEMTYAVRVPGEVDNPTDIGDFVIEAPDGQPIFIRDVATVTFGFEDRLSYSRIDGRESVSLSVQKRVGANIIEVADAVHQLVEEQRALWPEGVDATLLADQSDEIRRMVSDLENNILSGLLLVVLVLMFVLGLRNAIFVGLAIPFSMLLAFNVLQLLGITLNVVVLFSLVLAVGMLVDNAVVVIENIYRHMEEGESHLRAASIATREVGAAIVVSTFTTVAAFSPLLFWPGIVGDFMSYLPKTVSWVLLASLLVAFTINPVICSRFMRVKTAEQRDSRRERVLRGLGERFVSRYERVLGFALDHRLLVIGGTLALFVTLVGAYATALNTGVEFFPETEPERIFVDVETPPGTQLEVTDRQIRRFEEILRELPDIKVLAAASGSGSQQDELGLGNNGGGNPTRGRVIVDLVKRDERDQNSYLTLDRARELARSGPGVKIFVDRPQDGPPVGDPLSVEVRGEDFETLGGIAEEMTQLLGDIPGLVTIDSDFDLARPEVRVLVDRTAAARRGLNMEQIARAVRTAINGTEASIYRWGDDEADVVVRLAEGARTSLEDLGQLTVVNEDGVRIPLAEVAQLERSQALTMIIHKERKRVVTVSGKVARPQLADPVRQEARKRLEARPDLLPPGYSLSFAGQSEDEEESKAFLLKAFGYGLLLVLVLMVTKFDSLVIPLIILSSVLMSMVGVIIGLIVTAQPFGIIMTGLGVISLGGIVVNNAIVLLDYGEQQWAKGELSRRELVLLTGTRRFRPVLLTAITTILGLIPLSTGIEIDFRNLALVTGGESSQWWSSMAVAVIFGLAFATFLTLVVVPVLYDLVLQLRERRGQRPGPQGEEDASAYEDPSIHEAQSSLPAAETENRTAAAIAVDPPGEPSAAT